APIEMQRVGEKLQLIPMEPVTCIRQQVKQKNAGGDNDNRKQTTPLAAGISCMRHRIVCGARLQHTPEIIFESAKSLRCKRTRGSQPLIGAKMNPMKHGHKR